MKQSVIMMSEKAKNQHSLPNRQVAKAFRFSADDLAANRAGFITKGQEWAIPLSLRAFFSLRGRRQKVDSICGRIHLKYEQYQIHSLFHADFVEVYHVQLNETSFRITKGQYQTLHEGLHYRLYYKSDAKQILSLERVLNSCHE